MLIKGVKIKKDSTLLGFDIALRRHNHRRATITSPEVITSLRDWGGAMLSWGGVLKKGLFWMERGLAGCSDKVANCSLVILGDRFKGGGCVGGTKGVVGGRMKMGNYTGRLCVGRKYGSVDRWGGHGFRGGDGPLGPRHCRGEAIIRTN